MAQMKDALAGLLAFLFAQDQKEHPMPPGRVEELFKKIKQLLRNKTAEQNTDDDSKGE